MGYSPWGSKESDTTERLHLKKKKKTKGQQLRSGGGARLHSNCQAVQQSLISLFETPLLGLSWPAMQETGVQSPGEDPLEKEMSTHSNMFVWRIPQTEESGGLLWVHGITKSWTQLSGYLSSSLETAIRASLLTLFSPLQASSSEYSSLPAHHDKSAHSLPGPGSKCMDTLGTFGQVRERCPFCQAEAQSPPEHVAG